MSETRTLARFVAGSQFTDLPQPVRHEATRALVNWIGNPIWGCRDAAVERSFAALDPFSGPREAAILGRPERIDPLKAALLNGMASSIADYDDTHLATVIHPTGPVAAALLALVERHTMTGAMFLHALALGIEVQCRIGLALAPGASGAWYMTGVTGGIGAAAAVARVLGLDEERTLWAMGIAAARAAGSRETHGTMAKNLATGCAASDGLFAAFLAERGFEAAQTPIEGKRGLASVVAPGADFAPVTAALGRDWELMRNAYKPFPSGIVTHAAITGALALAPAVEPGAIAAVKLAVNPLCLELCGRRKPANAVEATFSVYHWVAVALIHRAAGIRYFSDATVRDPAIVALRDKVDARADAALRKDEAVIDIALSDGTTHRHHVAHAMGAVERPPSDAELSAKLADLVALRLAPGAADRLSQACWNIGDEQDAAVLARAACGQ